MFVELAPSPPHIIGPTWQKTATGDWYLPEKTLGWGILNWWYKYVRSPGGKNAGGPFVPTLEQVRFVLWWYAVDEHGNYVYREGILRRLKGWGKDPIAAALALAELCGPVAFSHFDTAGNPVGKRRHAAWIDVAAVSQDQTKNTFRLFPVMISKELKAEYGLEVNKLVIYAEDGGHIEAITSSPASGEGHRPTFTLCNETQWWGTGPGGEVNDGVELDNMLTGNVSKIEHSRKLSICNAHIPGNNTVGEAAWDQYQKVEAGDAVDTGVLYDALEAPADTPLSEIPSQKEDPEGYEAGIEKLRQGLLIARGDSYWLPIEEIIMAVLDTRTPVEQSRRRFLNQINAHEDSWITPSEWDRNFDGELKLESGDKIVLGFDGSKSNDHTALVACRIEDGALFLIKTWNPENYVNEEVPRDEVDDQVRAAFGSYNVVAFRADVKEFEAYVDQWSRDFKKQLKVKATPNNPVAFDMRGNQKKFALDCERLLDAVIEGETSHNGDPVLRQHVLNARRHPTIYDAISIRKASKDSSRKIDAAVCAVLAFGARQDFLMSGKDRTRKAAVIM